MKARVPHLVAAAAVAASLALLTPITADAGGGGKPAPGPDDPRSGAALNRLAAQKPAAPMDPVYPENPQQQVLQTAVNNPAADATAQDTQSETTIAAKGNNVIVAWNDSGSFTGSNNHFTGWAQSGNNGLSFADKGALPTSTEGDAGDPVLAVDQTVNATYLATLGFTTGENLQVFKSTDDGQTFGAPVNGTPGYAGTGDFQDKEWLAVDNTAGAGNHNVYLCWTRFLAAGGAEIRFTRSLDQGATFGPNLGTLISTGGQGCFVVVGPDHAVYVFFYRGTGAGGQGGDNKLFMRKSTDQGVTWGADVQVADLLTTTTNGNLGLIGGMRSNSFPHAAINQANGNIYVVYNDNPADADNADVFLTQSTNGGATWSAPVQANSDDAAREQFFPTVATIGPALMIGYYSKVNDSTQLTFHRRSRLATIAGASTTFKASFQLGPDTPVVVGQDPVINATYMGDYDQIATTPGFFHSSWSDNRDGNTFHANQPDVRYARINSVPVNSNPGVTVTAPASATVGDSVNIRASITNANPNRAEDVFVRITLAQGLVPKAAAANGGGDCDFYGQVAGCYFGGVASGTTKTFDITAFAATSGVKSTAALLTTSSNDTSIANNSSSASTNVTGSGTTTTYSTGSIAVPLPDLSTVEVPIDVPDDGAILTATAGVRLNHTFDGDLALYLISPIGKVVALSTNNGGSGDNYGSGANDCTGTKTLFSDGAATSITAGVAPFAGSFKPEQALSAYASDNPQGGWKLRVVDSASGDVGTVGCVTLTLTRQP